MRLAITALLASFTLWTSPLAAQVCQVPASNTISYSGTNCSTGNGLPCAPGQPVTMTWGGPVQACDTFQWNFGDGTTASGSATQTHTFAAGGRYTVQLNITSSGGSNMSRLFLDVDHERFWWSSPRNDLYVTEGDVANVEVRRWVGTQTATIDYYTRDGVDPMIPAVAGKDYVTTTGTLTFQPGEYVKTIPVPTIENSTYEGGQIFHGNSVGTREFFLGISGPSIGTIGPFPAVPTTRELLTLLRILEDDPQPVIAYSSSTYTVSESAGSATMTLLRSGNLNGDLPVQWLVVNSPLHLRLGEGTVVIPAGQTSATYTFTFENDTVVTPDRSYRLIARCAPCTLELNATLVITEDDIRPTIPLRIEDKSIVEGLGLTNSTTTVSLSKPHTAAVDVRVQSAPGTATADDYVPVDRVVRIEAGQTSVSVPLAVVGDPLPESEETFTLTATLQCCTADITIEKGTATVSIVNDDAPLGEGVTLTASPRKLFVPEGSIGLITVGFIPAPSTPVTVTVHSSNPSVADVPTTASLAGGNATLSVLAKAKGKATLTLTPSELGATSQAIEVEVGDRAIVTPPSGMTTGGTSVSIIAAGLEQPCEVRFGNVSASQATVLSPTSLMTVAPAVPAGVVDLRVTCGGARFVIPSGFRFSELRRRPTR